MLFKKGKKCIRPKIGVYRPLVDVKREHTVVFVEKKDYIQLRDHAIYQSLKSTVLNNILHFDTKVWDNYVVLYNHDHVYLYYDNLWNYICMNC